MFRLFVPVLLHPPPCETAIRVCAIGMVSHVRNHMIKERIGVMPSPNLRQRKPNAGHCSSAPNDERSNTSRPVLPQLDERSGEYTREGNAWQVAISIACEMRMFWETKHWNED